MENAQAQFRPVDRAHPPAGTPASSFGFLVLLIGVCAALFSSNCLHQVPEGHVGVYWRGGALLNSTTNPGFHLCLPFLTSFVPIQITLQTDEVTNIPCGTKGGVMVSFGKVEVVNRLNSESVYDTIHQYGVNYDRVWIYDKIHHEINQFCSSHTLQEVYIDLFDQIDERMKELLQKDCDKYAPGIEIVSVRVTKPRIPDRIAKNYEIMEEERTSVLVATERQRVVEKNAETEKKKAISEAEKAAQVSHILNEQFVAEKESEQRRELIENEIWLARQKSYADADFYRATKEAEANRAKLTPEFLELAFIQAIANNSKIFFGDKLPNMVVDQRLLGDNIFNSKSGVKSKICAASCNEAAI